MCIAFFYGFWMLANTPSNGVPLVNGIHAYLAPSNCRAGHKP
jgi:hypothetical protein